MGFFELTFDSRICFPILAQVDSAPSRPAAPFLSASTDLSVEIMASFFESKAAILFDKTRKQYTPVSNAFNSNMSSEIQVF